MNPPEDVVNRERQIATNYATRIAYILDVKGTQKFASPHTWESFDHPMNKQPPFDLEEPHDTEETQEPDQHLHRMITLNKLEPSNMQQILAESTGKRLPEDSQYFGILTLGTESTKGKIIVMEAYLFNKKGDSGVMRHRKGQKGITSDVFEDLKNGDYERVEWLLQDVEESL